MCRVPESFIVLFATLANFQRKGRCFVVCVFLTSHGCAGNSWEPSQTNLRSSNAGKLNVPTYPIALAKSEKGRMTVEVHDRPMGYQDVEGGSGKGGSGVSGGSEGGDSEGEDGGGEGVGGEGVGGENGGGEGGGDEEGGGEVGVGEGGFRRPVCYAGRRACAWRRARAREGSRKPLVNCSKAATR